MSPNAAALLYLVAGVLFILALRGLSSPESSRRGNAYGMIGMAIAIATTLGVAGPEGALSWGLIIGGIAIGGTIGATIARRIVQMTAMPQLVAAFHSLVGLAAVFVAAAALNAPEAFGIGAAGRDLRAKPDRDVAGRCDRRDHLLRLDHRLRRSSTGACRASRSFCRSAISSTSRFSLPCRADRCSSSSAQPAGCSGPIALAVVRARSSCSSFRSAARTCRSSSRC